MTGPAANPGMFPARPESVVIATYPNYLEAQKLVDRLSDKGFPVQHVRIIGRGLHSVEQVITRMTTAKAALMGAASGAWFGLLVGLLLSLFTITDWWKPVLLALLTSELGGMNLRTPSTLQITDPRGENGAPQIIGSPAADVTLTDVDISNTSDPVASRVEVVAELPSDLMIAEANIRVSDATGGSGNIFEDLVSSAVRLTALTPHPDRGVLTAEFSGGLATADLRPVVRDGGIAVEVEGGSVLGVQADGLISRFADAAVTGPAQQIGHGFTVAGVEVTDGGMAITLDGRDIALSSVSAIEYR